MRLLTLAVPQFACTRGLDANLAAAERLVRRSAGQGAQVVLIQELFATPCFCITERPEYHIPQGPGYEETYCFSPGDTGFRVWDTAAGRLGVGIRWDQWFPGAARAMALAGAEVLLCPTAIGSEPPAPGYDSQPHWEAVMRGHAAANIMPLAAANRIGTETAPEGTAVTFCGSSVIADQTGQAVAGASRDREEVLTATFDPEAIAGLRRSWGLFRDRRVDLSGALATPGGGGRQIP